MNEPKITYDQYLNCAYQQLHASFDKPSIGWLTRKISQLYALHKSFVTLTQHRILNEPMVGALH